MGGGTMLWLIESNDGWASCVERDEAAPDSVVSTVAIREQKQIYALSGQRQRGGGGRAPVSWAGGC